MTTPAASIMFVCIHTTGHSRMARAFIDIARGAQDLRRGVPAV